MSTKKSKTDFFPGNLILVHLVLNQFENFFLLGIIRFQQLCDKRDYNELSKGVALSIVSQNEVMIRIDENSTTEVTEHESDITLFVQRGYCLLCINNSKILMQIADKIKIPKCKLLLLFSFYLNFFLLI